MLEEIVAFEPKAAAEEYISKSLMKSKTSMVPGQKVQPGKGKQKFFVCNVEFRALQFRIPFPGLWERQFLSCKEGTNLSLVLDHALGVPCLRGLVQLDFSLSNCHLI